MGLAVPEGVSDAMILDFVRELAIEGYESDEELFRTVGIWLARGRPDPAFLEHIERLASPLLDELHEREAEWPIPTDNDRLDRAFAALERDGILARQHWYGSNQAVADEEMRHELQAARLDRRPVRGFAFFTGGDTWRAIAGEGLRIHFGAALRRNAARAKLERASWEIAQDVHRALWEQHLSPSWSRVIGEPITLPFTWRRRRRRTGRDRFRRGRMRGEDR